MREQAQNKNRILRHSAVERAEHWLIALSGFVLLFSGFGEFPMYKRYMVTQIPGLSWAGDFWINLKIHYIAAIVFTGAIVFHAVYHGILRHRGLIPRKSDGKDSVKTVLSFIGVGEEPPADKYLAEQRLAYAYIAAVSLILVATGLIKVIKNLSGVYLPPALVTATTLLHTTATFLFLFGVIAHLAALALKVNWPLIRPMFTGTVDLDYVRHRHSLWYAELTKEAVPDAADIRGNADAGPPERASSDDALSVPEKSEGQDSKVAAGDAEAASPDAPENPLHADKAAS